MGIEDFGGGMNPIGTEGTAGQTSSEAVSGETWLEPELLIEEDEINQPRSDDRTNALALASFVGLVGGAAMLGRVATRRSVGVWYRTLRKPPYQPPSWIFGPVWTTLYGLMAASAYRVWKQQPSRSRSVALALWGTQLAMNAAWTPLFFGARKKRAALVDLAALVAAVAAYAQVSKKIDKPAAAMMIPYLGWLGFAGLLNEELIRRNRGIRRFLPR